MMNISRPTVIALCVGFVFGLTVSYLFINTQVPEKEKCTNSLSLSELCIQCRLFRRSPKSVEIVL